MQRRLLILLLLAAAGAAQSQYLFRHLDQRDGLLHNNVYAVTQDASGYVWISTKNGLQRFDGLHFKSYREKILSNGSLSVINNLYTDSTGNVWAGADRLVRYNGLTDKVSSYANDSLHHNAAFRFDEYRDEKGHRWLLGDFGLYAPDSTSPSAFRYYSAFPNFPCRYGNLLTYDKLHGTVWAAAKQGMVAFDLTRKKMYTAGFNPQGHPLLNTPLNGNAALVYADSRANLWIGLWEGFVVKYEAATQKIKRYALLRFNGLSGPKIGGAGAVVTSCLFEDERGTLWVGTDGGGLLRYDEGKDDFVPVASFGKAGAAQFNYIIYCISGDRDGNLWLGTDKGLSVFHPYKQFFQTLAHSDFDKASLPKNEIISAYPSSDGTVYVGTWGGGFSLFDKDLRFVKTIAPSGTYEQAMVWCFTQTPNGTVWAGAQHGYLHLYHPKTGALQTLHPPEMKNATVRCLAQDKAGNIWFGLHNGAIVQWNAAQKKFFTQPATTLSNALPILQLFLDDQRNLWGGSENGLLLFDAETLRLKARYLPRTGTDFAKRIRTASAVDDSTLMLATDGGGVLFFNKRSCRFYTRDAFAPLAFNRVFAVQKDVAGNLWLTSDYSLSCCRKADGKLSTFPLPNGLLNGSFEMPGFAVLTDGRWLTATTSEVVVFDAKGLLQNSEAARPPLISGFRVRDSDVVLRSFLSAGQPLRLSSGQNFISIDFAPAVFSTGAQPPLQYKLSGVDKEWMTAPPNGTTAYTNMPPGEYRFEVRSADAEGSTSALAFVIAPPFYLTWWFVTLAILFVAALVYYFVKRRIRIVRREAGLKQRIAEAEMDALRAQMNPHFIFNCLNAIDNMIQTDQREKATAYLHRFARLIRSVLDSAKNKLVPVHKDVEALKLYLELERFRCSEKFDYTVHVDQALLNGDYKTPPLVVQPFLENAIHHGLLNKEDGERLLQLTISLKGDDIAYSIRDNGVGRRLAAQLKATNKPEHQSYGIQISTERVHLHNQKKLAGDVTILDLYEDEKPAGTQIDVLIKSEP